MIRQPTFFFILSIIAFFFNCANVTSQENSWKYYSVAEGLPQSQIFTIYQDTKGYLWICTKGGLSRFDGIEFENYTIKDGLEDDFVISIYEDSIGTFFIGTRYGVNIMNDGTIRSIPIFKDRYLTGFHVDDKNTIWAQFGGAGLICVEDEKLVVDHPVFNFLNKDEKMYFGSANEKTKNIVFNTSENRTIMWDGQRVKLVEKKREKLSANIGHDGQLYGTTLDSLFIYERGVFRPWISIKGYNIKYINSRSDIYLIDKETYSYLFHYDGKKITKFHKKFNMITSLFVDDEKNLWVGTESGLWRLITKGFQNYLTDRNNNFYTWTVLQDKNDNYWFGSFLYGLKKYDGKNFTDYPVDHLFRNTGFQHFYSGGIKDKNGDLLFSAYRGVIKYDGRKFDWFYYDNPETIVYIYDDSLSDKLYFSSAQNGIIEIDSQQKIRYIDDRDKKENTGLVTSILKDKYDRLWICGNLGVSLRENDTWRNLPDSRDSIPIGAISMIKDRKDNLWFGSNQGLYFYDYQQLRKVAPEVFDGQIGVLNFAKSGELLIGSIKGIGLLDLEKFYTTGEESIRYFNNQNGFLGTECKHNSSFNDNDGNTWICTSDRVVKVNTDELRSNPNPPRVYIKSISTLSENMEWQPVINIYKKDTVYTFDPLHNDIRFSYHGISHSAPTGVVYQTTLEGYDAGWSAISKERYRTFTNLPQGSYTFKVKTANIDGVWTNNIANIKVVIEPAWHELSSVKYSGLIIIIFLAGGIGYVYAERKRRGKLQAEQNEKRIAKLQFKSLRGLIDPHFTFNAINSIASMVYKENRDEAYHYFTKFSKLIRTAFEDSEHTTRTIQEELSFVTDYLDIEKMRFKDRFDYSIEIDRNINRDWKIPKMIIQIYVENAIKHGLVPRDRGGKLNILLELNEGKLVIFVNDNGVGRRQSNLKNEESDSLGRGTEIFNSYFDLLNRFNKEKIKARIFDVVDDEGNPAGTNVSIFIPLSFKYNL